MERELPRTHLLSESGADTLFESQRLRDLSLMARQSRRELERLEGGSPRELEAITMESAFLAATQQEILRKERRIFLREFDLL
ncbi:hypothetical protein AAU61_16910 [Desulfocarbo indianensis]|nr:hypothetical protein AAU61_16910 [Desulfocarbo indianensis]